MMEESGRCGEPASDGFVLRLTEAKGTRIEKELLELRIYNTCKKDYGGMG
jgi:hypothetical protein